MGHCGGEDKTYKWMHKLINIDKELGIGIMGDLVYVWENTNWSDGHVNCICCVALT